jgi:hypothetical protein
MTGVTYREPFTGDNETSDLSTQTASAILSEEGIGNFFTELFAGGEQADASYRPFAPEYEAIESLDETSQLRVTPESLVAESEDRRTLGYTGQRKVLVDANDDVSVAYRRKYQDYYQIFLSELLRLDDGYILATPDQPVSHQSLGVTQRVPAIALDGRDLLHLVWYGSEEEEYPDRRQVKHVQTKNSRNFWEESDTVSYVEGYSSEFKYWQEHPAVTVGDYDDIFVVWEGKDSENEKQQVKFSRSLTGGDEWSEWRNIHPADDYTYSRPTMVYTPETSTLHLFAYSSKNVESNTNQIQYSRSENLGLTWTPWEIISEGEYDARHISATVVEEQPTIAYRTPTREDGPSQIVVQTLEQNATWTDPIAFSADQENYQFFPSIMHVADSDRFCVSWIQENTPSEFPQEDPTDGDIFFGCGRLGNQASAVYNLTPTGSHLYPALPLRAEADYIPIAYYDDDAKTVMLRLLSLAD